MLLNALGLSKIQVNECPGSRVIFLIPMACEIEKLHAWI
jgi:hypothetical protein